jgi:hypothetical protein
MFKAVCLLILFIGFSGMSFAQPWGYDFGTNTGSFFSPGTSSLVFLPQAPSGNDKAIMSSQGGSFNLENPGVSSVGSDSELRLVASSTGSGNKFSIYSYTPGRTFYTAFEILFGDLSGQASANSGYIYFAQGSGDTFSSGNSFDATQSFSALYWQYGSGGTLTAKYRGATSWSDIGSYVFSQGNSYKVEIYGNNSTVAASYFYTGSNYSVGANRQDIWVNGVRIGQALAKAAIANNVNIDSFYFMGTSSTGNVANMFIDNISYSNSFPVAPISQVTGINASSVSSSSMDVSWVNGNGYKRLAVINTSNSFINPQDGTDPEANPVYASKGQQVIYNGTGTSVTVSGLSPSSIYWFRIYEATGTGLSTRYNISTNDTNPFYLETDAETLPIELSSFTAEIDAYGKIQLNWVTQSETNAYGFYVLRATENQIGIAQIVSSLIGATNTSTQQLYQFTDESVDQEGVYYYWLQSCDLDGSSSYHGPVTCLFDLDSEPQTPDIPIHHGIIGVYPNPFNPQTTISYGISEPGRVELLIYNLKGQKVRHYTNSPYQPGDHTQVWDGLDSKGNICSSGIYNIVMSEGGRRYYRKVVLSK